MRNGIHFISGLPRSGSTLLSALLRQNPRIHASMTSPVGSLVNGLLRTMSQENETAVFIDDAQRERILRASVEAFYGDIDPEKLVFDTNRGWTSKLALLTRLFPKAKVICCVRSPAWVLDSIERLTRGNPLEPSGLFKFDTVGNVYSRAEQLMGGGGIVGHALNCLREAVFDDRRERLLIVRYESLTRDPVAALNTIYEFIGEPAFGHDPNNVEQDFDALEFDARLGAPGLHTVGAKVRSVPRPTIMPPELFHKYDAEAFWERTKDLPEGLKVV
ncbi:MAG TPA: sulfotransferase [Caulobacteraceae bacterium]|nr:sulfotransferase [Caulobacteraceae bacterium]